MNLMKVDPRALSRAQGLFNIVGGAWPLVSLRTFERIYGPKADDWLQKTSDVSQRSSGSSRTPSGLPATRLLAAGRGLKG
ncbi:hypothetical protein ABT360_33525, partial [Streptomyces sp. NPDC000229]